MRGVVALGRSLATGARSAQGRRFTAILLLLTRIALLGLADRRLTDDDLSTTFGRPTAHLGGGHTPGAETAIILDDDKMLLLLLLLLLAIVHDVCMLGLVSLGLWHVL